MPEDQFNELLTNVKSNSRKNWPVRTQSANVMAKREEDDD